METGIVAGMKEQLVVIKRETFGDFDLAQENE